MKNFQYKIKKASKRIVDPLRRLRLANFSMFLLSPRTNVLSQQKIRAFQMFFWIGWAIFLKNLSFSVFPHKGIDLSNNIFFRR
jgi:hypothetical protein